MGKGKAKRRAASLFLTAVMAVSTVLAGMPGQVEAAGNEGFLQSKISFSDGGQGKNTYLAYNQAANDNVFTWTGDAQNPDVSEENQVYTFSEIEDGIYTLVNVVDANDAIAVSGTAAGSSVVIETPDAEDTKQQWTFEAGGGGFYYVKNVASGLYMTTPRTESSDAMDLYLTIEEKKTESTDSQLWKPSIAVNEYTPESAETVKGYLASNGNANQLLSVNGGDAVDGLDIIMWQGTESNQEWEFQPAGQNAEYYIVNAVTKMALAVTDSNAGSQLVQKTPDENSDLQIWIFEETGTDGAYYIRNKSTGLFITADNVSNMGRVLQQTGTGSTLQIWKTDAEVQAVQSTIPEFDGLESGLASAVNTGDETTDQYLAVNGGSTADGAELSTWTGLNGGPEPNQVWAFQETDEEGVYRIVNTSSGRAIAAQNRVEGQRLVQKTIDENDETQLWSFTATEEENTYRI